MEYPKTPFSSTFDRNIITTLPGQISQVSESELKELEQWLCSYPKLSSYRVNTLLNDAHTVLQEAFKGSVVVEFHPIIPNVIIVHRDTSEFTSTCKNEVIVDSCCASAVLRGADVFAPGVIGMNRRTGYEVVSIFADLSGKCRKGFKIMYDDEEKLLVGKGLVKMTRPQIFGENISPRGVAVKLIQSRSGCVSIKDGTLPPGTVVLQNLPSISCVLALDPKPGESVLDMCASPGNKTTHIAELMKNEGILIAIDKNLNRVELLKNTCEIFNANVRTFAADARKILHEDLTVSRDLTDGPPFPPDSFDRILLDAPCSCLGQRPLLVNKMSMGEVKSYAPLQKKLLKTAVRLLKPNGTLTYSTCTITLFENEAIVAWALRTYKNLKLVRPAFDIGGPGWKGTSLSESERLLVRRFGPNEDVDSVGFFFACFTKIWSE